MILTAVIRSLVQFAFTKLLALPVVSQLLEFTGLDVTALQDWLTAFLFGAVVSVVNALGQRYPIINSIVSLGRANQGPVYVQASTEYPSVVPVPGPSDISAVVVNPEETDLDS